MSASWNQLAQNLQNAHHHFMMVAGQLNESLHDKAGICGTWSPRDVITHLIGWDVKARTGLALFANGEGEQFIFPDIDEFNAQSINIYQHLSWEEALTMLKQEHIALQTKIQLVEANGLDAESGFGKWLIGRKEDYELHTRQLQAWVGIN